MIVVIATDAVPEEIIMTTDVTFTSEDLVILSTITNCVYDNLGKLDQELALERAIKGLLLLYDGKLTWDYMNNKVVMPGDDDQ